MSRNMSRRDALNVGTGLVACGVAGAFARQRAPEIRLPREINVGIVGMEGHYSEIIETAKLLPRVHVSSLADEDSELLQKAMRNAVMKNARPYSDYRQMLDREKLDVVAVCGRNDTRARIVRECAERKLAIVAEKPLALSLEELQETRQKVEANGVPITILLPMRFSPVYQAMKNIVADGRIGEVVAIAAQKSYKLGERPAWMKSRKSFGGTIPYIGIHMIDLMRWISGREFTETSAFQSTVGFPDFGEMETNAVAIFRLDNRGTASIRLDYLRPETAPTHGDDRLRIAGTKGIVEYQDGHDATLLTSSDKPGILKDLPPPRQLFADFLDAIYNGRKHLITPDEIFRIHRIVLCAREAADSGKLVRI